MFYFSKYLSQLMCYYFPRKIIDKVLVSFSRRNQSMLGGDKAKSDIVEESKALELMNCFPTLKELIISFRN